MRRQSDLAGRNLQTRRSSMSSATECNGPWAHFLWPDEVGILRLVRAIARPGNEEICRVLKN